MILGDSLCLVSPLYFLFSWLGWSGGNELALFCLFAVAFFLPRAAVFTLLSTSCYFDFALLLIADDLSLPQLEFIWRKGIRRSQGLHLNQRLCY